MVSTADRLANASPLGFQAGDANLYRFVGNSPIDETDPSGLMIKGGSKPFFDILGPQVSDDERKILDALRKNPLFEELLHYIGTCGPTFELIVDPKLSGEIGGKSLSVPGETRPVGRDVVQIIINPAFKYPGKANPAEIANTILHELIHAALIASYDRKCKIKCPLDKSATANDIYHDPKLRDLDGKLIVKFPVLIGDLPSYSQDLQGHLRDRYGREPIYPDLMISDINNGSKDLIDGAIGEIIGQAGVGGPTLTQVPW